jgi:hypothetical protein
MSASTPPKTSASWRARAALAAALCALACGSGEHTTIPVTGEDAGADASGTQVASVVNLCPRFDGSLVTPQRITPGESALVAVTVTDPDGPSSELVFSWTATSGVFSASDKPVTSYTCSKLGTQQLSVVVKDRPGCTSQLSINVECVSK